MPQDTENLPATREESDFTDFLATINQGAFVAEATEKLRQLVRDMVGRAEATGGKPKGEIKLAFKFTLDRGVFDLEADVDLKLPKVVRQRQIMYGNLRGDISPNSRTGLPDPQTDAFRDVSTADPKIVRTLSVR